MNRRLFLAQVTGATLAAAMPPSISATLQATARKKGLLLGTSVSRRELGQADFQQLLSEQAGIVVCENDLKWAVVHPQAHQYDFTGGDLLMDFATTHGQAFRGHNLCWHEQLPKWFEAAATADNIESLLRSHIDTVAGHYRGQVHSWDVVNEAIHVEDKQPDGYRNSIWYQKLGPRFLEIAFHEAHSIDPHAILTYNDYDLEQSGESFQAKRTAVLTMVRFLRDKNVPIQAVGLQSHLAARNQPDNWDQLHAFLHDLEQLELRIFITELDVNDHLLPSDTGQRDAAVAAIYSDYLANVLQHKSVKAILTWGLSDADTWLTKYTPRKDGLSQRPLPFDDDLRPTAVYQAMLRAVENAPER